MSIWISNGVFRLTLAAVLIAGCVPQSGIGSSRSAPVLGGALQIGVPPGYCIDGGASRERGDNAVILMGRCNDAAQAIPALVSVSIGQAASGAVMTAGGSALAAFFTSVEGRATLSRDGRASDIKVIEALGVGDAFFLHLQDRRAGEYWRAVVGVKGRLVTVSATGTPELPLTAADSRKVLESVLAALRRANQTAS